MQNHKKSKGTQAAAKSKNEGATQTRMPQVQVTAAKPVPKPGDIVTISGKREKFIGLAVDDDHVRLYTVTDSTQGSGSPVKGTHTRFLYGQFGETAPAPMQQTDAQLKYAVNVSSRVGSGHCRPTAPTSGSMGAQRTPRIPRKTPATVRAQTVPVQNSNTTPDTERRFHRRRIGRNAWDLALLHDAAHIHRFDAGPSLLDQQSLLLSRRLGPCGTELLD